MTNIRVYDLSKELNVTNKQVIDAAKRLGITIKSHASSISEEDANKIREKFTPSSANGDAPAQQEPAEEKERVKVFRSETGDEVVERRKGRSIILRKRKKAPRKPPEQGPEPETVEAQTASAEIETAGDEALELPPTEPVQKQAEEGVPEMPAAGVEAQELPVETPPAAEAEEAAPTPEAGEDLPQAQVTEVTQELPEAEGKRAEPAEEVPKKKKAKRVKPKREEIIDEETLEELRRAFKAKLPGRRREYLVDDRKSRQRVSPEGARPDRGAARSARRAKPEAAELSREAPPALVQELPTRAEKKVVKIGESVNVGELAKRMSIKARELIKSLMTSGIRATINQSIDFETAAIVAEELGYEVVADYFEEKELLEDREEPAEGEALPRPPVVTVMGHVDHGKTTLLDSIRKSSVVEEESGGITQHIGAYTVDVDDRKIVFIDTPGHEAFTAMRARGAQLTDVVVLVVAADDGVMPQTVEAYNHAKAAEVPVVVALNKIDKPEADRDRVLRQLSETGLVAEEWGGDTMVCDVSAKVGTGIGELLEAVLLQADVLELKANPSARAKGIVIESKLDKGRGPVATVIVQEGTLSVGDYLVAHLAYGRVRALIDDKGSRLDEAGPSIPAEVLGLSSVPEAGGFFHVVKDEKTAKEIIQYRENKEREKFAARTRKISLEGLYETLKEGEVKELPLIIKGDTHGSVEALKDSIEGIESDKCRVKIIHTGVGAIHETDVTLASASNAIIVGFNVRPDPKALALAEKEGVSLEFYEVIYNALDRVKNAMIGLLEPIKKEKTLGHAEVKAAFQISKVGTIAGCSIKDGAVRRADHVRVVRDGVAVYEGKVGSLKRFKEDVREVQTGYECGIGVENFNDIKVGDILEIFAYEELQPEL